MLIEYRQIDFFLYFLTSLYLVFLKCWTDPLYFFNQFNRLEIDLFSSRSGGYLLFTHINVYWAIDSRCSHLPKAGIFGFVFKGNALELYCSKHNESTMVASVKDFARVKEGGCDRFCDKFSACGHHCRSLCHNHEDVECREPCRRWVPYMKSWFNLFDPTF